LQITLTTPKLSFRGWRELSTGLHLQQKIKTKPHGHQSLLPGE